MQISDTDRILSAIHDLRDTISRKFEHHDRDLRAEVEKVNQNFDRLISVLERLDAKFGGFIGSS